MKKTLQLAMFGIAVSGQSAVPAVGEQPVARHWELVIRGDWLHHPRPHTKKNESADGLDALAGFCVQPPCELLQAAALNAEGS